MAMLGHLVNNGGFSIYKCCSIPLLEHLVNEAVLSICLHCAIAFLVHIVNDGFQYLEVLFHSIIGTPCK